MAIILPQRSVREIGGLLQAIPGLVMTCADGRATVRHPQRATRGSETMITLYGMGSPNVVKVYIALEELGLPYTVQPVDVFTGQQFDAAFLKLNPNAKVPV